VATGDVLPCETLGGTAFVPGGYLLTTEANVVEMLVEPVCMRMFTFVVIASLIKFNTFCAPVPIEYSSDSAEDSATTACVRLPNCTVKPIRVIVNPLVDFLVVGQLAQSAST
jgi:hypothetical protein